MWMPEGFETPRLRTADLSPVEPVWFCHNPIYPSWGCGIQCLTWWALVLLCSVRLFPSYASSASILEWECLLHATVYWKYAIRFLFCRGFQLSLNLRSNSVLRLWIVLAMFSLLFNSLKLKFNYIIFLFLPIVSPTTILKRWATVLFFFNCCW